MTRLLLTGGSGDLGQVLSKAWLARGDSAVILDVQPPRFTSTDDTDYIAGSVTDRELLDGAMSGIDCIVHIAAWHGVHENPGPRNKSVYEFWDVNVTGTFNVFEAAARAGVKNMVYISSTSRFVELHKFYGQTKVLGEDIAKGYVHRHQMNVVTLQPRAFIPHWNRDTYSGFMAWAQYFWGGATHIDDVLQGVIKSVDLISNQDLDEMPILVLDSGYEFSQSDFDTWDQDGPGASFRRIYPEYVDLALEHGFDTNRKPNKLDGSAEARQSIGYEPAYSLKSMLDELEKYGPEGPPAPF
jgi:nucleoside-diphosphate-sugar epimerase